MVEQFVLLFTFVSIMDIRSESVSLLYSPGEDSLETRPNSKEPLFSASALELLLRQEECIETNESSPVTSNCPQSLTVKSLDFTEVVGVIGITIEGSLVSLLLGVEHAVGFVP